MLLLASQSPRRKELLERAGFRFTVQKSDVPEIRGQDEAAAAYVTRLAQAKAQALAHPERLVLGADTTVVVAGEVLEKPVDAEDARRMLRLLSGRTHEVLTGICLLGEGRTVVDVCRTSVTFATLSEAEIEGYIASGEPFDKAGAYGIQGLASRFVTAIDGDYNNIVGLPVALVYRHVTTFGSAAQILDFRG